MAINPSIAKFGVARITNPASLPTTPTFTHGLLGGTPFAVDATAETTDVSCGVRASVDAQVNSISVAADIETEAYADVLGLYLYAACGAIESDDGDVADTYEHAITLGATLPELVVWGQVGASSAVTKIEHAKIDQLDLDWGADQRLLRVGLTIPGLSGSYGSATWPGSSVSCFDGAFTCTGGSASIGVGGASIGSYYVKSGNLSISNNVNTDYAATSVSPAGINEGKLTSSGNMVAVFDSDAFMRLVNTGSVTGTTADKGMLFASFSWEFVHTKNPDYALTVTANRIPVTASAMEADPSGSQVETTISWADALIQSAAGTPVTFTLINGTEEY